MGTVYDAKVEAIAECYQSAYRGSHNDAYDHVLRMACNEQYDDYTIAAGVRMAQHTINGQCR